MTHIRLIKHIRASRIRAVYVIVLYITCFAIVLNLNKELFGAEMTLRFCALLSDAAFVSL